MQADNKILDDLARVAGGALGAFSSLREEAEGQVRAQLERILSRMDVVSREEFDAVRAIAAKAREEQEALAERLAALEAQLAALTGVAPTGDKDTGTQDAGTQDTADTGSADGSAGGDAP